MGVPSIACQLGVSNTAIYYHLKIRGIPTRPSHEALRGKVLRPITRVPVGDSPLCKCGCGDGTGWNSHKNRWNVYVAGHYRRDAPYKNSDWLREEYLKQRKSLNEIARSCGVSRPTILKFMRKYEIQRRGASESHRGLHAGEQNPSWKGGVTPERQRLYKSQNWKQIIGDCFSRDRYRCVRCSAGKRGKGDLHAHHINAWADAPLLRMDITNLVTLCRSCHLWVHSKENQKREFLST